MTFRVSQAARGDIARTARWYDGQPGRYGSAFLDEIDAAFKAILANPRIHSPVEDGIEGYEVREFFIARFQQRVIFWMTESETLVVSVVHATRREGSWHDSISPLN